MDHKNLWLEIEKSLANMAKRYEWFTKMMSFGYDERVRKYVSSFIKEDDVVLELGSGPGTMAQYIKCKE